MREVIILEKIKIVNVVSRMIFGGVESVIYNYYSNMDLSKFDITIITQKRSNPDAVKKFEELGFKIIMIDNWEKKPFSMAKTILKIFKKEKFDILHCHLSHTNFYFLMLGKMANIPIRISHSHLSEEDTSIKQKIKHFIYKKLIKHFSTLNVACGDDAGKNLYGKHGNYLVLKNGIYLEKYLFNEDIRNKYRRMFKIKKDTVCIGTVGRLTKQKNQEFLIKIFDDLLTNSNNIDYKLVIVGAGEEKNKLVKLIKNLKIEDKVLFLENRNDVDKIMQMFDIFILTSLYEGLPVVGVEAQASDLPCIFSNSIDSKIKITDKVYLISLSSPISEWVNQIKQISCNHYNRENNFNLLTSDGYNIKNEAIKLQKIYENECEEIKK